MATWQRRSTLGSLRVIRVTAFGRSSLSSFPLYRAARSCCFLAGDPDRLDWGHGVMPNFASTEFSEVRQEKMSKLAHASTIARRLRCPPPVWRTPYNVQLQLPVLGAPASLIGPELSSLLSSGPSLCSVPISPAATKTTRVGVILQGVSPL